MKFVYPEINRVFDLEDGTLNTLVIENQRFLCRLLSDIRRQIDGSVGKSVLSQDDVTLDMAKNAEIVDTFIPFEINRKTLLSKVVSALEKQTVSPENYENTMKIMGDVEAYLNSLAFLYPCDIVFPKLSASSLIRCAAPELREEASTISGSLIDYMELVSEFDKRKLFITVNMRSFVDDEEMELFGSTVIPHGYDILMIESAEHPRLSMENRLIIDRDLCEIA